MELPPGIRWATPDEVESLPFGELPPGFEGIWVLVEGVPTLAVAE